MCITDCITECLSAAFAYVDVHLSEWRSAYTCINVCSPVLGVTRYKVTHYCNSTTFRGNEHVTKYFFKSSNAVTITEIEISSLLALLSFVNNEHLETRRQDRPTLAASDLTSQDHGGANRYTNRINQ